ncbi:MAG: GntR family transcriptional regulator [Firmicutes bacterium]|nr:GntR family transcriptional regulator [Bacillota bacterium]
MENLGKHVPIPLYFQIKTRLLELIENGQFKPGDQVPSERELTERFSVSRMTARQALTELESQGYLYRIQGKGTFVATPKLEQPLAGLTSFTEDMRRRGLAPGARVLTAQEAPAGKKAAKLLGIAETATIFRLERLRLADGEPMALETSHIPVALCPGLLEADFRDQSLYRILAERCDTRLVKADQSLEAVPATAYDAEMLHVREGTPLLLMERVSRDASDKPVEFVRSLYRGDRYRFTTELIRREESL